MLYKSLILCEIIVLFCAVFCNRVILLGFLLYEMNYKGLSSRLKKKWAYYKEHWNLIERILVLPVMYDRSDLTLEIMWSLNMVQFASVIVLFIARKTGLGSLFEYVFVADGIILIAEFALSGVKSRLVEKQRKKSTKKGQRRKN